MNENNFILILENLVGSRFWELSDLADLLEEYFDEKTDKKIKLVYSYKNDDIDDRDFVIVGRLKTETLFCDFDIYYTKSKNHAYITEVGYEFY